MEDFGDTTGMINPIFRNNQNNNNIDDSTMINPFLGNMNQGNNLDDMLNEMSKVILNLQSDMSKVMTGINQLNLLISNIQKYRKNNNMMGNNMMSNNIIGNNNMMGNMMSNNIMGNNNMMGNNMMNNMNMMNNINMMGNNMMNNMNMMNMGLMPIIPEIPKSFNIIFRRSDLEKERRKPLLVKVNEDEKVSEIIQRYREKYSDFEQNLKFIFNAKELNTFLSVAEHGLSENANIFVEKKKVSVCGLCVYSNDVL